MNKLKMTIVGALAVAGAWCVQAEMVSYLDPVFDSKGVVTGYAMKTAKCTEINTKRIDDSTIHVYDSMTLGAGWYVVTGQMEVDPTLTISGEVKIILKNKSRVWVNPDPEGDDEDRGGQRVEIGSSLTIYAQSTDMYTMGQISAYGGDYAADIGSGSAAGADCGTITINGGTVESTGGGGVLRVSG